MKRIYLFVGYSLFSPVGLKPFRFSLLLFIFGIYTGQAQQTYTFTNCSATDSVGPTQGQINTAYASTNLSGSITMIGSGWY